MVSFIPTLFDYFFGIPSLYVFSFLKMFLFCDLFQLLLFFFGGGGGGGIELLTPDTHVCLQQSMPVSASHTLHPHLRLSIDICKTYVVCGRYELLRFLK